MIEGAIMEVIWSPSETIMGLHFSGRDFYVGDRIRERQRDALERVIRGFYPADLAALASACRVGSAVGLGHVVCYGVVNGRRTEISWANLVKRYDVTQESQPRYR